MQHTRKQKKYQWLFIFVIYSDYSHKGSTDVMPEVLKELFSTFKYTRINNTSKIAIIHNRVARNKDQTLCSHVVRNQRGKNDIITLHSLTRDEVFLLQKKEALSGIICSLKSRFPSRKHCIVTCDHGSILGINTTDIKTDTNITRNFDRYLDKPKIADKLELAVEELPNFNGPPPPFEILTSDELAYAILNGLNKKAELVIMYNCYGQTIMTQYALRGASQFLIAPGTSIVNPGYNFKYVLKQCFRHIVKSEYIIRMICDSFVSHNSMYYGKSAKEIDKWGVWGFNLSNFDDVFLREFNRLTDLFIKLIDLPLTNGKPLWCSLATKLNSKTTFDADNSFLVFDLIDIIEIIQSMIFPSNISTDEIDSMLALLKQRPAYYSYIGKKLLKELKEPATFYASGYLILLPKNYLSSTPTVIDYFLRKSRNEISFFDAKKVSWVSFLDKYLEHLPIIPSDTNPCIEDQLLSTLK